LPKVGIKLPLPFREWQKVYRSRGGGGVSQESLHPPGLWQKCRVWREVGNSICTYPPEECDSAGGEQAPEGSPAVLLRVEEPVQKIYFSIKIVFYKNIRRGGVSGTHPTQIART